MTFVDRLPSLRRNYYRRVRNAFVVAGAIHAVAFVVWPAYRPVTRVMRPEPLRLLPAGAGFGRSVVELAGNGTLFVPESRVRTSPVSGVIPAREGEVVSEQWTPPSAPSGSRGTSGPAGAGPGTGGVAGGEGVLEEDAAPVYYGYDTPPRALRTFEPAYPIAAKASGFEGTVVININLDERGGILRAWVASANAPELLITTALDAVYQFRFAPGLARGVPVKCTVAVPFRFLLKQVS